MKYDSPPLESGIYGVLYNYSYSGLNLRHSSGIVWSPGDMVSLPDCILLSARLMECVIGVVVHHRKGNRWLRCTLQQGQIISDNMTPCRNNTQLFGFLNNKTDIEKYLNFNRYWAIIRSPGVKYNGLEGNEDNGINS